MSCAGLGTGGGLVLSGPPREDGPLTDRTSRHGRARSPGRRARHRDGSSGRRSRPAPPGVRRPGARRPRRDRSCPHRASAGVANRGGIQQLQAVDLLHRGRVEPGEAARVAHEVPGRDLAGEELRAVGRREEKLRASRTPPRLTARSTIGISRAAAAASAVTRSMLGSGSSIGQNPAALGSTPNVIARSSGRATWSAGHSPGRLPVARRSTIHRFVPPAAAPGAPMVTSPGWCRDRRSPVGSECPGRPTEVRAKLREVRERIESGAPVKDASMTVAAWLEDWITKSLAASDRKQATKDLYATLARTHLVPTVETVPLGRLRPPGGCRPARPCAPLVPAAVRAPRCCTRCCSRARGGPPSSGDPPLTCGFAVGLTGFEPATP